MNDNNIIRQKNDIDRNWNLNDFRKMRPTFTTVELRFHKIVKLNNFALLERLQNQFSIECKCGGNKCNKRTDEEGIVVRKYTRSYKGNRIKEIEKRTFKNLEKIKDEKQKISLL